MAKYLLPGLKSILQTYFNGVLDVGQFENTVPLGTCNNFNPLVSLRVDIARIWPSSLNFSMSAEVWRFMMDLSGILSVDVDARGWRVE